MTAEPTQEQLDTLACDITARPHGAPGFDEIMPAVRRIERAPRTLTIDFAPESYATVEGCVAAERLCCAEIGWELEREPAPRLRITATPPQLDVLEQIFIAR